MPLGIQRVNARPSSHPTPHIGFIKPLPGPGSARAHEFLARVAAICHPILVEHHLAVMTLEEHEPNTEFLGRNFNAGEVIQLVLRRRKPLPSMQGRIPGNGTSTPRTGIHTVASTASESGPGSDPAPLWLPFRSVVLVMLHELAHCTHMHHGKTFWHERNRYAAEMRELWAKGYTGEGMWGRGRALLGRPEELEDHVAGLEEGLPADVCGGVYRRRRKRGRKRKRGEEAPREQLTYAERQQRRIRRKFGEGGIALGDDEIARAALEQGAPKAKGKGKPRVAQSARGRELRAQAALARLGQGQTSTDGQVKKDLKQSKLPFTKLEGAVIPEPSVKSEEKDGTESVSATESEEEYDIPGPGTHMDPEADLVKICPDTAAEVDDSHVKSERQELRDLYSIPTVPATPAKR